MAHIFLMKKDQAARELTRGCLFLLKVLRKRGQPGGFRLGSLCILGMDVKASGFFTDRGDGRWLATIARDSNWLHM